MHDHEPCGVDGCPALACSTTGFCSVHADAKIASGILVTIKCTECKQDIRNGDWITRDSVIGSRRHAHCPKPKPPRVTKKDSWKPLSDDVAYPIAKHLIVVALLGLLTMACGASSPTAPSVPVRHVALTVRALTYATNAPIAHVSVAVDGAAAGQTDDAGALALEVVADVDHIISVHAAGLAPLVPAAEGVITRDGETWTFWLAPAS